MSIVEKTAARILPPLSAITRLPLKLGSREAREGADVFAIRSASERVTVICENGRPLLSQERVLLDEIFRVALAAEFSDARVRELENIVQELQSEKLDLLARNRVLSEATARDTLTGLYNRSYVVEKLDSEMSRATRTNSPMAVLMLDIDHFKRVNDSYGHGAGDLVLQCVGKVLRESCRAYDVPGRFGGEEFCVVLPETRLENTTVVAERIRERLAKTTIPVIDGAVIVTASIGIAAVECAPVDGVLSPGTLLERADRALYSAKNLGRNRVELWSNDSCFSGHSAGH